MSDFRPLTGWAYSMHRYHRTYYKKLLHVQELEGAWYCWVQGCPEQVAHQTMEEACQSAMELARTGFPG